MPVIVICNPFFLSVLFLVDFDAVFCECMFPDVLECTEGRDESKERALAEGRDRLHHLNEIWQTR